MLRRLAPMLVVLVLLAGCGEGSSASRTTTSGATGAVASTPGPSNTVPSGGSTTAKPPANPGEARFLSRADEICSGLNKAITRSVGATLKGGKLTHPLIARIAPRNALFQMSAIGRLSKLRPPAAIAAKWRTMLGLARDLTREMEELGVAARTNEEHSIEALGQSKKANHAKLKTVAGEAGFKACGEFG